MSQNRKILIKFKDGKTITIDKIMVSKITIPSFKIKKSYFKLNLDVWDYKKTMKNLKKLF